MKKTFIKLREDLSYDPLNQIIVIEGQEYTLTSKECELFHLLASNVNRLTDRKTVLTNVWGENNFFVGRSMDVYITRLRKKLSPLPGVKILSVNRKGHKLIIENAIEQ